MEVTEDISMKLSKLTDYFQIISAIIMVVLFLLSKTDYILYSIMQFVFGVSTLYKIVSKRRTKADLMENSHSV